MGSKGDSFASLLSPDFGDRNKPMMSMKSTTNTATNANASANANANNHLNRVGSLSNIMPKQPDGQDGSSPSFKQNGNSPMSNSGSGNKLSGMGAPSQSSRSGYSARNDPLSFLLKDDMPSSPPMMKNNATGAGLNPGMRSFSAASLDSNLMPDKNVPSPDTVLSDSTSDLDFLQNASETTSPDVTQPAPDFGFGILDTSASPPQPQPVQMSMDSKPGDGFDLLGQSAQNVVTTASVDFLTEDKTNDIFGSTTSFASLESDTNTVGDDSSNHADPNDLGSIFQNSAQGAAEITETISSISDPLTRAELEALANEIRRNFQNEARTNIVPDPWNPFGTSQDDMAEMQEKVQTNHQKPSLGAKNKMNGGSSWDANKVSAPSSVPARTSAEENSTVQLSGESEERYKLRMDKLNRIQSKVQDKEEEIRKQREKERSEAIELERIHEMRGAEIEHWAQENKDIRSMLSTLESVMWQGCGYKSKSQMELIQAPQVKKAYLRAIMIIHPDKVKSVQAKYVSGKIFPLIEQAYRTFQDQELV